MRSSALPRAVHGGAAPHLIEPRRAPGLERTPPAGRDEPAGRPQRSAPSLAHPARPSCPDGRRATGAPLAACCHIRAHGCRLPVEPGPVTLAPSAQARLSATPAITGTAL